jgi:hypothetical protein
MRIPSLTPPLCIPASRRHTPSIMGPIYVSVTRFIHEWRLKLSAIGPRNEKSIEGFEPAFKELGSCAHYLLSSAISDVSSQFRLGRWPQTRGCLPAIRLLIPNRLFTLPIQADQLIPNYESATPALLPSFTRKFSACRG